MKLRKNDSSLGAILLDIGAVTEEELQISLDIQQNSSTEKLLGIILLHEKFCTPIEIESALYIQNSLRKGKNKKVEKALIAADIAIHRKRRNHARAAAIKKGAEFYKRQTGKEYPAITRDILAKDT